MPRSLEEEKVMAFSFPPTAPASFAESPSVELLADENEREVLAFLSNAGSVQAVFMTSLVRDNGLESPFNRGVFYGARSGAGSPLAGVALIGHATLVETEDEAALEAFARIARATPGAHVHLAEEEKMRRFWATYRQGGQLPRLVCREVLFELRNAGEETGARVEGLRLATLDDLAFVMPVQACMALEESGVDPMERDPVGFRLRCARRIEQGRVFVWIEDNRLLFKADILADTREAIYLEGVYTSPSARNQSNGTRCLMQMARELLSRTRSIKLLGNEHNHKAHEFYRRAGFRVAGCYDTIFLQTDSASGKDNGGIVE